MVYSLLRKILFRFPPEDVHYFIMNAMQAGGEVGFIQSLTENTYQYKNNSLQKNVFELSFKNPVGLGAGFDKNARYLKELEMLGFGSVEAGTVTPLPQVGNDKPRLFRLPNNQALINRMGFNNDGVKAVRKRLEQWQHQNAGRKGRMIVGGNIGKNKVTDNEDAWKDYEICFNELFDAADYFVVNVSSPNTPGLRALQQKESLRKILSHLQTINHGKTNTRPLLLKIAPDLSEPQLDDVISLFHEVKLDGLVATNTTLQRHNLLSEKSHLHESGGLSGKPLNKLSSNIIRYISNQSNNSIPIIASGGIFTGADAVEKMDAGATLLQVWTGFIYEGPSIVKNICSHLSGVQA